MKKIIPAFMAILIGLSPLVSFAQVAGGAAAAAVQAAQRLAKAQAAAAAAAATTVASVPISNPGIGQIAGAAQAETEQSFFVWIEEFIRTTLMKTLLDQLVDGIIGYVQGDGDPKFVTDWKGFLTDAGDQAAGAALQKLGAGFLCEPFSAQIQIALLPVAGPFSKRAQCTLTDIVGNITNFANDFRNGGWIAYSEAWKPQNNFFGALLLAEAEVAREREDEVGAKLLEGLAGQGFLSIKDENGNIVTPGKALGDLTSKALGTDIDFVLNADQLGDYVEAITNALINRVIKEGVTGVKSATTRREREAAASQNASVTENNFDFIKTTTLNQINLTLEPSQQSKTIIVGIISMLNNYIVSLNSLFNSFSNLSQAVCQVGGGSFIGGTSQNVVVADVKASITAEIDQAEDKIAELTGQKSNLEALIEELQIAKAQIEPLTTDNSSIIQLTNITQSLIGLLDPVGASNFKTAMEEQQSAISSDTNSKLSTFNQQLQQCLASQP